MLLIPVVVAVWFTWRSYARRAAAREWQRKQTAQDVALNPQNYAYLPDPRDFKKGNFIMPATPAGPQSHVWEWSYLRPSTYGSGDPRGGFQLLTYPISTLAFYDIRPVSGESVSLDVGDGSGLLWRVTLRGTGGEDEELGKFDDIDDAEDAVMDHQIARFGGSIPDSLDDLR